MPLGVLVCSVGCGPTLPCKDGTAFVTLTYSATASAADMIELTIVLEGTAGQTLRQSLRHDAGSVRDTVEIDFAPAYPRGKRLTVDAVAIRGGTWVGAGHGEATLEGNCSALAISVGGNAPDDLLEDGLTDSGVPLDVATPDLATLDLTTPDLTTPDLATSDLATPDLAMPDLTTPDLATPDLATPDLATPDLATPDLLEPPDFATPDLSEIDLLAPDLLPIDQTTPDTSPDFVPTGPVVLALGQSGPFGIVVDSISLYWTNQSGGTVMRMPIAGGSPEILAMGQSSPLGLAIAPDFSFIAWANAGAAGSIVELALPVTTVWKQRATGQSYPQYVAADVTTIYWANWSGTVMAVAASGGTPITLASGQQTPWAITVDSTFVYWTNYAGTVMRVKNDGSGMPETLASGQAGPDAIAVDAANVYWANAGSSPDSGYIMRRALTGGNLVTVASGELHPNNLAVDATHVYWSNWDDTEVYRPAIKKAPIAGGGPVTTLAIDQFDVQGLAVDATSVYWTLHNDGAVMRAPK